MTAVTERTKQSAPVELSHEEIGQLRGVLTKAFQIDLPGYDGMDRMAFWVFTSSSPELRIKLLTGVLAGALERTKATSEVPLKNDELTYVEAVVLASFVVEFSPGRSQYAGLRELAHRLLGNV